MLIESEQACLDSVIWSQLSRFKKIIFPHAKRPYLDADNDYSYDLLLSAVFSTLLMF